MVPRATPAELAALLRAASIQLSEGDIAALHSGPWARIEAMIAQNAEAGIDWFDEPAASFDPEAA